MKIQGCNMILKCPRLSFLLMQRPILMEWKMYSALWVKRPAEIDWAAQSQQPFCFIALCQREWWIWRLNFLCSAAALWCRLSQFTLSARYHKRQTFNETLQLVINQIQHTFDVGDALINKRCSHFPISASLGNVFCVILSNLSISVKCERQPWWRHCL
jgi:hypothetical protein